MMFFFFFPHLDWAFVAFVVQLGGSVVAVGEHFPLKVN
jgi:hypothetical protein